jgi:hypothetical protein
MLTYFLRICILGFRKNTLYFVYPMTSKINENLFSHMNKKDRILRCVQIC